MWRIIKRIQKRLRATAFTPKALKELEPMIYEVGIARLVDRLRRHADAGESVNLMSLMKYMTFVGDRRLYLRRTAHIGSRILLAESHLVDRLIYWMRLTRRIQSWSGLTQPPIWA